MPKCREFAAGVLISLAASNLVLPFSLLSSCFDACRAQANDIGFAARGGVAGKAPKRSAGSLSGSRLASAAGCGGKDACPPLQRPKIDRKHRLCLLGRAMEPRPKDGSDALSSLADNAATSRVVEAAVPVAGSCRIDASRTGPSCCIDLSRLTL